MIQRHDIHAYRPAHGARGVVGEHPVEPRTTSPAVVSNPRDQHLYENQRRRMAAQREEA